MGGRLSWRTAAASVAGAGHRVRDLPCQDACAVESVDGVLLVAVADGAGSAPLADEGAFRAVDAAIAALRRSVGEPVSEEAMRAVLLEARAALVAPEEEPVVAIGDRATTLLVARVDEHACASAQVGDGAIVVRRDGALEVLAPVARHEYLNETCFLTSEGWEEEARVEVGPGGVDALAAMSDGLQLVAFDLSTGLPHAPFFAPFFDFVAAGGDAGDLEAFLGSERVAERTDDDVTLAVATLVRQ